jgi:DNA-binding transcriptional regulator GbsR (MarR family)
MTATAKKITAGKVKVITLHTKNLYRAFDNYYQKAFYLEKDICASVGQALKTLKRLQAASAELAALLEQAQNLPEEVKKEAQTVLEDAKKSIEKGLELKKRLKEFEAATNIYKKNPTEENKARVEKAIENLKYPLEGNKTLWDYVQACNPWKKYLAKRVNF